MDQRFWMTPEQRIKWNRTIFALVGRCTDYPDISKQWTSLVPGDYQDSVVHFWNLGSHSCLNGWTMGNVMTTTADMADMYYELFNGGILNQSSIDDMMHFKPMTTGFAVGLPYGLGLMDMFNGWPTINGTPMKDDTIHWIGHGGEDYASAAQVCGYNPQYGYGICIAVNSVTGMNCSSLPTSLAAGENFWQAIEPIYMQLAEHIAGKSGQAVDRAALANTLKNTPRRVSEPSVAHMLAAVRSRTIEALTCPTSNASAVAYLALGQCYPNAEPYTHMMISGTAEGLTLSTFSELSNSKAASCEGDAIQALTLVHEECFGFWTGKFLDAAQVSYVNESTARFNAWAAGGVTSCVWEETMTPRDSDVPETATRLVI
eukprot:NODE_5555_length_1757_cov_7.033129.p1 GENE.NODE_5555_length_1757_cov_7.033129~~NODE_5555_length_1757_cov_7.033129.p1  ORF type:complete len:373 (-),score=91.68 NODE_5555_length_1757_cov_7.033129:229-1347(-)